MKSELRIKFYLDNTEIYQFYFGDFNLSTKYNSPFRDDPVPSFMFKSMGSGTVIWTDFGLTEKVVKDGVGFVAQLFDLTREEAIDKIWTEMVLDSKTTIKKPTIHYPLKVPYEYELEDLRMHYYTQFHFTKEFLNFYNVYGLKILRRIGKKIWESSFDKPMFIYLFKNSKAFKAYNPLTKEDRFRGQDNGNIIEGYDQLPRSHSHLIICSSLKDTKVVRRLGYCACNPTSENSFRTLLTKSRELTQRFSDIYILFDNDSAGINSSKYLSTITGWKVLKLPKQYSKDPSDLVMKAKNYLQLSLFFNSLFLKKIHW